ncbi:uncharacterized protein BX663DRAFT_505490 [Cokeromyces recurvatus]|uniref:uncharacterized protein n=1 Tax=Cokeromyces recurvatus TaxID=90255 RepID=UPI00221F32A2|nr:uncharacterized protein BX663DRAFT_505490 [Cokeromyces recurvatus]KAI7903863.1 hypothetical protein BX663DRAFT_505490 [Cokeromyces recurvatus]
MNEFGFPPMLKDMSSTTPKVGGMLYTEPSSFNNNNNNNNNNNSRSNKSNVFSQTPQEFEHWRSNSLPTSALFSNTNNSNTTMNTTNNPAINPVSCDLQEVIVYYQSQPELLRLILLSKVEEDKRRAEEAKLRAKELDMFLLQQQQQLNITTTSQTPDILSNNNNLLNTNQFAPPRRPSALEMLMDDSDCNRRDSALGSSFDGSANSDEMDDRTFSPNSSSMLSMSFHPQPMISVSTTPTTTSTRTSSLHPLSPPYNNALDDSNRTSPFPSQIKLENEQQQRRYYGNDTLVTAVANPSYFPSTTTTTATAAVASTAASTTTSTTPQRPRRRREMQAISKIVETRDYPYVDGYFWKNNGNTIQKKTGNKSVYYKCSNSSKGCPVNKTVTWKENGEYLIKYRGEHLPECGKVQRIVDM